MSRIPLAAAALACLAATAQGEPITFVALGDAPYGKPEEVYAPFRTLIETVNATDPVLVIHVGDTKSGSTPCSDELLAEQLGFLDSFTAPLLYTPGDNEWTDCHRPAAGGFDPLDRLTLIRSTYFSDPATPFGAPGDVTLSSQAEAGYPENARTQIGDVMFVTAHVIGSNNNFETRDRAAVDEFFARDAANADWLTDSFATATGANAGAVVVAIQADMFGPGWNASGDESWAGHSGFATFGRVLIEQAAAFAKPVLLVYGDSHVFQQSRPFPKAAPNLMAVEVPGAADMHALQITADTAMPGAFAVSLLRNPALSN